MMNVLKSKYVVVYDTPMVHEPFVSLLGIDGLSETADKILTGEYILPLCIHPDIVEVIEFIKMDDAVLREAPVQIHTDFYLFKCFWKNKREKIASSMSKIHNVHYIAAAANKYVGLVTSLLSIIPWEMGYMLTFWKQISTPDANIFFQIA